MSLQPIILYLLLQMHVSRKHLLLIRYLNLGKQSQIMVANLSQQTFLLRNPIVLVLGRYRLGYGSNHGITQHRLLVLGLNQQLNYPNLMRGFLGYSNDSF